MGSAESRKHGRPRRPKLATLESADLHGLVQYIQSNKCKNIVFMLGAGVSTSAGIPDFRSPETGLYSNLARLKLPYPEAVFEIGYFQRNPVPFYTLAQELYPGKFRPTITHSFIRLIHEKGLLLKCFTQNIDTLERRAGVPDEKIIEAHGSFATQRCIKCQAPYDDFLIKVHIKEKTIPRCDGCKGLVKPDIVFFGESLPEDFISSIPLLHEADLLIVMGTSLTVHPFAMLAGLVEPNCPRVLINLEEVGDFSHRADDVLLLGRCDEMVRELCQELGWEEDLNELWKDTEGSVEKDEDELDADADADAEGEVDEDHVDKSPPPAVDNTELENEVAVLTSAIEKTLSIDASSSKTPPSNKTDRRKSESDIPETPEPKKGSSSKPSSPSQGKKSPQRL